MDVFRAIIASVGVLTAASGALAQGTPAPPSAALPTPEFLPTDPMDDGLRAALRKVVVKPGASPTAEEIGGDYDRETLGLEGGMVLGASKGSLSTQAGPVMPGASLLSSTINVRSPFPACSIAARSRRR